MVKGTWIALGVLAAILLVVLGGLASAIGTYNAMVDQTEGIDAQAKQVDVAYQRAFRLVPQLTALAERYMQNERDVLQNVTALRAGLAAAENGTFEAKDAYLQEFVTFVALVGNRAEAYPQLRADALFQQTMDEVVNSENKIAMEKVRYNERVETFNAHRRKCCLPLLVANFMGFGQKQYTGFEDRPNQAPFPSGTAF